MTDPRPPHVVQRELAEALDKAEPRPQKRDDGLAQAVADAITTKETHK